MYIVQYASMLGQGIWQHVHDRDPNTVAMRIACQIVPRLAGQARHARAKVSGVELAVVDRRKHNTIAPHRSSTVLHAVLPGVAKWALADCVLCRAALSHQLAF